MCGWMERAVEGEGDRRGTKDAGRGRRRRTAWVTSYPPYRWKKRIEENLLPQRVQRSQREEKRTRADYGLGNRIEMSRDSSRNSSGLTLVELMASLVVVMIPVLVAGMFMVSGQRSWQNIYGDAYDGTRGEALAATVGFTSTGRRSNRLDYELYEVDDGTFTVALPESGNGTEIVFGEAVEFRYWDQALSVDLLDVTKTGTVYALFYLDEGKLKVDRGPYPPGGVDSSGSRRTSGDITTEILANNVSALRFNHTMVSGAGQGCVRMNLTLGSQDGARSVNAISATLMRNVWPR